MDAEKYFICVNPMGDEKNVADTLLYCGNGLHEIAKALERIAVALENEKD